jgi:hypothetical protein
MEKMSRRSLAVLAALAVVAAGCGTQGDDSGDTLPPATPVPTVAGVGLVPVAPSAVREPIVVVRPPVNADGTEAQLIGEIVDGNRILMIGDSILASTSSRYGDHMCEAVVPLGWQVAVEAEPSRFIDFGNRVLDKLLVDDATPEEDWNAAVVFLGSNYGSDEVRYEAELVRILDRLAPRPTLLLTVTEYRPDYVEVNEVVNRLGAERDNVTVLYWKTISETPGVLSNDRLHPTDAGRRVLAESVAAALGPVDGVGECLRSTFRDDSRVGGNTTTVLGRPSTGSGSTRATTSTTIRPSTSATTTTVSSGSGGSGSAPTTTSRANTTPTIPATPTTAPASTTAPSTAPPSTAPPSTAPASTAPPSTAAPTPTTTAPALAPAPPDPAEPAP